MPDATKQTNRLARHAGAMSAAVMLSRLLGLLRDLVFAFFFGATWAADAFNLAFIIPNLLRRLFGEGALAAAFVPIYQDIGVKRGREQQIRFGLKVLGLLSGLLAALCVVGILLAPWIVRLMAPGFDDATTELATRLTRILFPYLFLIGLSSTFIAILNSHDYYFVPGLSSAFLNLGMIAVLGGYGLLHTGATNTQLATMLALGTLLGGVLQTVVNWPLLRRVGYRARLLLEWRGEAMQALWRRFLPGVLGIAVWQVNAVVDRMLASLLVVGSISALAYGYRLMQLPLGIFGVALGTAAVPHFSRCVSSGDWPQLNRKLRFSILSMLLLMLPVTTLIAAQGQAYIRILFLRGAFDQRALEMSYLALLCYSLGLVFFSLNRVLVPVFYAHGDTRTPVKISVVTAAVNIVLDVILMQFLAHAGLALGTSIAAAVQTTLLLVTMHRRFGHVRPGGMARQVGKVLALSLGLYVVIAVAEFWWPAPGFAMLLVRSVVLGVLWIVLTAGGAMLLGVESSREVGRAIGKKLKVIS